MMVSYIQKQEQEPGGQSEDIGEPSLRGSEVQVSETLEKPGRWGAANQWRGREGRSEKTKTRGETKEN